ncbi:MAG: polysaccharide deacetylase family protein [Roseimicrobium sp.]
MKPCAISREARTVATPMPVVSTIRRFAAVAVLACGLGATSCSSTSKGLVSVAEAALAPNKALPKPILRVPGVTEKIVVLTIDDGPSSRTEEILSLLREHEAQATFFVHTDHMNPAGVDVAVRAMLHQGHEVGNHMPCDVPTVTLYRQAFRAQLAAAHERLLRAKVRPKWFRPAGGRYQDWMPEAVAEKGYEPRMVLASALPWDVTLHWPRFYAWQLGQRVFPGAIVVFHDGTHRDPEGSKQGRVDRTLLELRLFLDAMKRQGYKVATLGSVWPKRTDA